MGGRMRIGLVFLGGWCAMANATAEQQSSACESILQWDALISARKATISRLLRTHAEEHPDVIHMQTGLATLEASRAADVQRAKAQGLSCTPVSQSKSDKASAENTGDGGSQEVTGDIESRR